MNEETIMLEQILESLDKDVFDANARQLIREEFDNAASQKAALLAEQKIEEYEALVEEYEALVDQYNEKIDLLEVDVGEYIKRRIDKLETKAEEYVNLRIDELEQKSEEYKDHITEKFAQYADRVVEEFIQEAKESLIESVESKEIEVMHEAYQSMIESAGVDLNSRIMESVGGVAAKEIRQLKNQYNDLVKENVKLNEKNRQMLKLGIIKELSEDLSLIESERFSKLAEMVTFSQDEKYVDRLETLKESIKNKGDVSTNVKRGEEIKESVKPKKESLFNFEHLV
jgi:hypothetical protein